MSLRWHPTASRSRTSSGPPPEFTNPDPDLAPFGGPAGAWPAPALPKAANGSPAAARRASGGPDAAGQGGGKKLAEVARGSTLNLVGAAISAVTTVGVTVLVTQRYSRATAGAFFSATSLFLVIESLASLGAYTGAVYFVARLRLLGEHERIKIILRAAIVPVIVASVTAMLAMLIFATPLAQLLLGSHLGHDGASEPALATALRALAVTLPFAAFLDTALGACRGYRDMRPGVVIDKIGRSLIQTGGVAVAAAAGSVALLAPLWALPYLPAAAAAWLWLRRIRRTQSATSASSRALPPELAALLALASPVRPDGTRLRPGETYVDDRVTNATARGFWRFTAPRSVAVLAQTIVQRLDIVLVAVMRGPAEAAVYTAATRFLVVGQLGNIAISSAAQPQFTELFAMGARRRVNVVYHATTAWVILLIWPLYLLILVNGRQFLAIFGHSYRAGSTVLVILSLSMLLSGACGQVDVVLITAGKSTWSLVNGLLAMAVNVSLDFLLIPKYGITGAAIAWALAIAVANLMPLAQIMVTAGLHPFGRGMYLACVLSVVSFAAIPLAVRMALGPSALSVVVGMLAGTIVMAAGLWIFREPLKLSVMPIFSHVVKLVGNR